MKEIVVLLLLFTTKVNSKELLIFDKNKPYYSITTANNTVAELQAANLLQNFLKIQSGTAWQSERNSIDSKQQIVIKDSKRTTQECKIYVNKDDIYIEANEALLKKSVALFLEKFAGTRVYSDDVTYTPKFAKLTIPDNYNDLYKPSFECRLLYERSAFNALFSTWHGLSNVPGSLDNNHSLGWGLWVHTFFDLVPPNQYFKSNPEYFSLRNGKRVAEQLCLSNKALIKVVADNLAKMVAKQPGVKNWSISQMDNQGYCECDNCSRIAQQEKAQSGPIIRFVNEVAGYFPNLTIGTLAYQYSRKAPAIVKAAKNVTVTICSYESDRSKPLNSLNQKDNFANDLKQWLEKCDNMMVWDYVINFSSIATPFPNFHVLQPNLQYFNQVGVRKVFEQGWHGKGSGLQEYRAYLLSKLLWDANANVENIKANFFNNYYGKGGSYLLQVFNLMQKEFEKSDTSLSITSFSAYYTNSYLTKSLRNTYLALIGKALSATKYTTSFFKRVDAFAQAFRLAEIEVNRDVIGTKIWVDNYTLPQRVAFKHYNDSLQSEFVNKTKVYGPETLVDIRLTPDEWLYKERNRFKEDAENNLAADADITFKNPSNHQFRSMGPKALVDGAFGNEDWSRTWQGWYNTDIDATLNLKKSISLSSFTMRFMRETNSGLEVPKNVLVMVSNDGKNYNKVADINRPVVDARASKEIVSFTVKINKPVTAKYVHIIAKAPDYVIANNEKKPAFIFTDEIYLR